MNIARNFKKPFSVLRNFEKIHKLDVKYISELAAEVKKELITQDRKPLYWTEVSDPRKHTSLHYANFYTVPPEDHLRWLSHGLEPHFYRCTRSFKDFSLMVRKPALEVMDYLHKAADAYLPTLKFILHGRNGCGKSCSLAHLMHFAGLRGWVVVHVPWAAAFNRLNHEDMQYSTFSKEMRVDLPSTAVNFLTSFQQLNQQLLNKIDLRLTKTYTWNKREQSGEGDELKGVVEFGISRPKYATDVVGVLLKELKLHADGGGVKMMVAIDGVNAFWSSTSIRQDDLRTRNHPASELSLVHFFKKLLLSDWHNGAVVCTVDGNAQQPANFLKYLPIDLLGQEGFEHIDPFLPVYVGDYDEKEFFASLQYLFDKKWFVKPYSQSADGVKEIKYLSCMNPTEIYRLGMWM